MAIKSGIKPTLLYTLFAFLSLFLVSCEQSAERQAELVNVHVKQAKAYTASGQYRAAAIEARNIIQKAPLSDKGFILLANILSELGQHKDALMVLDQAPPEVINNSNYLIARNRAYIGRGKYQSALDSLNNHSSLAANSFPEYQLLLAEASAGLDDRDTAKQYYQQILQQQPSSVDALWGLAALAIQNRDFEQANQYLDQSDALEAGAAESSLLRAQISVATGDLENAENHLSETLIRQKNTDSLTPQKASTLNLLSEVLVKQGRSAEALIYTQILAEAFPGFEAAQEQYQQAYQSFKAGDLDAAELTLTSLVAEHPGFENAALMLAIIKYQKGDYESAASHFNPNIDPELAHPDITWLAALSNLQTNQPKQVMQLLAEHKATQQSARLLTIYGGAALAENAHDEGVTALKKAIQIDPATIPAYIALAAYYSSVEPADLDAAIDYLQSAYQRDNNPNVASRLVRLLVITNQQATAKAIVEQQLKEHSQDIRSLGLAGDYHNATGDTKTASNYYHRVLEQEADNYPAAIKLAEIAAETGADFSRTLAAFERAITIKPNGIIGYQRLLRAAQQTGQITQAEKLVSEIARKSQTSEGHAVLATYFSSQQDIGKAEQHLTQIEQAALDKAVADNAYLNVYYAKARAELSNQHFDPAKQSVFAALRIQPKSLRLLALLTEIEIASGNFSEAEKLVAQIGKQNKPLELQLAGSIAEAQQHTDQAIERYQSAWNLSPNEFLGSKLYSLLKQRNPQHAAAFLQRWLAKNPDSVSALLASSRDLLVAGQFKQAVPFMEKVRSIDPENVTNLNNLAWALQQLNDAKAEAVARQAYELAPDIPDIADTYGWILYQNGAVEKARQILQKAATLAPDNKEIQQHLAQAQEG